MLALTRTFIFTLCLSTFGVGCASDSGDRPKMASEDELNQLIAAHNSGDVDAGNKIVCRAVRPIGSNIPERDCRTVKQFQAQREEARRVLERRTGVSAEGVR